MASYCTNCGAPVGGPFCTACGAQIQSGGSPVSSPAPAAAAVGGGSAAKVILIVAGGVVLLGAVSVAGLVYAGYRAKQKVAEFKQQITGESATRSTPGALPATFPPSKGSGCPMLQGQEASRILGVAIERVESVPNETDGAEECRYWVSAAERQRLAKSQIATGVGEAGKTDEKGSIAGFEKLIGGALGAAIEAAGDNKDKDFAFSLQIYRSRGQAMWGKMEETKANVKGVTGVDYFGALGVQPVEGVGDKAALLPAGHSIMVLKGDTFFLLGFQQFAPGREKTAELAKVVAGRL